jgi:hypothetical protein
MKRDPCMHDSYISLAIVQDSYAFAYFWSNEALTMGVAKLGSMRWPTGATVQHRTDRECVVNQNCNHIHESGMSMTHILCNQNMNQE